MSFNEFKSTLETLAMLKIDNNADILKLISEYYGKNVKIYPLLKYEIMF